MQTENFVIGKSDRVADVVNFSKYRNNSSILIQIFSGRGAKGLKTVVGKLKRELPQAHIVGVTTDGEIYNNSTLTESVVVSISIFEKTSLKSVAILEEESSFDVGKRVVQELVTEKTKLLILFSDAVSINAERLLNGITEVAPNIVIAGGIAGNNGIFTGITLAHNGLLTLKGVVAVALDSDDLTVHNDYNFNWQPIGKEFTVTKSDGNILYELDNINIIDIYSKYFGDEVVAKLPRTGIEFPLIIKRGEVNIARAMLNKNGDSSLTFAGNFEVGEKAQFGIGNIELILEDSIKYTNLLRDRDIESFFIYSCMARRRLMPDHIHLEIEPFNKIAPVAGFFTYGEFFYRDGKNELLNQTMTYISLSENSSKIENQRDKRDRSKYQRDFDRDSSLNTIKALMHLVNSTVEELNETILKLSRVQKDRDEKEKVLTESIEYASHIQRNIIPPSDKIDAFLKEHMVIWEPRDRVGGDVYFFEEFGDEAILILVDAVGHGIPGAFITMSIKAIEQSIMKTCINIERKSPVKILEVFDRSIKNISENKNHKQQTIGFDGVVILINKSNKTIKFAGANGHLCYIKESGDFFLINGDKTSIGYKKRREKDFKSFQEHEINVESGDKFYIATDGFRDQIGGDNEFSFGKKRCQNLVKSIFQKSFYLQRKYFIDTLREWQGEHMQTDDITVIGFQPW